MSPPSLDILLVVVSASVVTYLWWRGVRQRLLGQQGYLFVTTGFTLLLLGLGLDLADNYASTRNLLFIGGVVYSDYLRWYAGYALGGILILVGFVSPNPPKEGVGSVS